MPNVVFVAPFFLPTTLRFVEAASGVEEVRLVVVTQEPREKLPASLRPRVAAHLQVADALSAEGVHEGLKRASAELGSVDRLLGALEELQVPLGALRDALGIPGMGAETAGNFRDKARMKDILRAHDLPCARHALAGGVDDALAFAERIGYPLILKPPTGSGARRTFRVESDDQLRAALALAPPAEEPTLVEEFVTGEEHSFDAVSIGDRVVWHSITHYFPAPLEVLREPWIQWCVLLPREVDLPRYAGIRAVAADVLEALGMETGLSHMEWFLRSNGSVAVSEVGARPPGAQFVSLMSWAHDFDLYEAWARLMVHGTFEPRERPYAAGIAYLRGQGSGRVRRVAGLEDLARELGPLCVESRLPREGQPRSATYEGEGYLIVRHPETETVQAALERIVTRVRVELG